jgi:hypothetical protein
LALKDSNLINHQTKENMKKEFRNPALRIQSTNLAFMRKINKTNYKKINTSITLLQ